MTDLITKGRLPNLRNLIIPDTTMSIIDMDLARADIQVVAWEANALRLKALLIEERTDPSKDIHTTNARDLFDGKCDKKHRDLSKKIVHAANYLVTPRSCAAQTGILVVEAECFIKRWFYLNSEIPEWHKRIARQISDIRTIRNAFGYRRFFFGRTEDCLPEAVAWTPSSTVAIVINTALCNIEEELGRLPQDHPERVELLLQVHDSLTMQCRSESVPDCIRRIRELSLITIPYPDPLVIPVGFKVSGESWGQVKDWKEQQVA